MNIQDLAFSMERRLDEYYRNSDPEVLRGEQAEELADRLFYAFDWFAPFAGVETARAFNVAVLLAEFHYRRCRHDDSQDDMQRAMYLYPLLIRTAPHLVPEVVLSHYRDNGHPIAETPSERELLGRAGEAGRLLKEAEATGDRQPLDDAVEWCLFAARANPRQDAVSAEALVTLGAVFTRRYEYTGNEEDLERALHVIAKAVPAIPEDDPVRLKAQLNFGHAAIRKFQRNGDLRLLGQAVKILRQAAYGAPADSADRAAALTNLCAALITWHQRTAQTDAAQEAVEVQAEAVRITPEGHPDLPSRLVNLAAVITGQAGRDVFGDDRYDAAVAVLDKALALVPGNHPDRPGCQNLLASVLLTRFAQGQDPRDLTAAVEASSSALKAGTVPDYLRPGLLRGAAEALSAYAKHFEKPAALVKAVGLLREADQLLPDGHPDRTGILTSLGIALRDLSAGKEDSAGRAQAVATLRAAAAVPTAPVGDRALAASLAGAIAADDLDFTTATDSYAVALEQLELAVWRGLERPDRENLIAKFPSLVTDAAACAVRAGQKERAVELLEQGRGILLSQAMETRTDTRELRAQAPHLADRLAQVLEELERLSDGPSDFTVRETDERRHAHSRRADLAGQRDELLAEIRALPGQDRFLRAPSFAMLRASAARGPVVLLVASAYGCSALLLTEADVKVVSLDVEVRHLAERTVDFLDVLGNEPSPLKVYDTFLDSLTWLWKTVTKPVLDALGSGEPVPPGGPWPRLWWCPTGLFTLLPIHAAGNYDLPDGQPDTVLDRVISSYTPTLRVLLLTRERPAPPAPHGGGGLIVSLPTTPDLPDLPAAVDEARDLHRRHPDAQLLTGPAATGPAVTTALTSCTWAHFACHGRQDIGRPSLGALMLHDGPLALWDIADLRLPHAGLAFLSACETSRGGVVLADEAISFAAAVQLAGFQHVIGTLWPIDDAQAPVVADRVYEGLSRQNPLDPAAALHRAVRAMRAQHPLAVFNWGAYVHIGP
ncbi:CHAT domain-containing protein [Streptomyces sp. NPDC008240]|uniref:CHAT domain-containing protein n=2 Tax=unclassified Streptomyces TaxID=2593676 RepID=UPI0036E632EA